jgi:phenylacetate-coenzyme A ligase PaaK-like adenylate-forming protein
MRLKSVLLSTDHVSSAIVREIKRVWGCEVFEHYGMTEMGLGGGIDCSLHGGYHLREADLYFEIIDPVTGAVVPDGQEGEVVVTTLTRQGMPLIRYRTGDISRILSAPCGCGTILRRLAKITQRKNSRIRIEKDQYFTMSDLDEVLFAVSGIINFAAVVDNAQNTAKLHISALTVGSPDEAAELAIYNALEKIPAIYQGVRAGTLAVGVELVRCEGMLTPTAGKRGIVERIKVDGNQNDLFNSTWQASVGR